MITTKRTSGTEVWVGQHRLCIITDATPQAAIDRFVKACENMAPELHRLGVLYEEKRRWNHLVENQGRNWPVFGQMEKLLNRLLKEAGIKDS